MKIVVDSGIDLCLPEAEVQRLGISQVPLSVTFKGKTYRDGLDISREDFYALLEGSPDFPSTSQPSPGQIAEVYKTLAASDPELLSVHISSGLSGTYNAAQLAARLAPQAHITHVDTKTLSVGSGWQAVAAARALAAGWPLERVLALARRVGDATEVLFTLKELRYLVHGGRISHIKGLVASLLNIKPVIGVEKERGTYVQMAQARSFEQAVESLAKIVTRKHAPGSELRAQVVHARNPDGADMLQKAMDKLFKCKWLPACPISLVLGAHTGPSVVGLAYASEAVMAEIP